MASPPLALAQSPPASSVPRCWSELPLDLMQLIFERLSFTDFESAKSVCSSWQTGWRQSKPNNKIPWMILFPEEKNYCLLFNPEDREEKLYKTQHLGDNFATSYTCVATYRSWLLMDPCFNNREDLGYILNILTLERINLPLTSKGICSAILWIDDKTKDYLVVGETLVYLKKGYNSWKQISEGIQKDIVFKDHKLYCLDKDNELRIFDFSGEFPLQVSRVRVGRRYVRPQILSCLIRSPGYSPNFHDAHKTKNVVVTVGGDVFIVKGKNPSRSHTWNFKIFKMDSSKGLEEIVSLGDEAIILDLGITVVAKDLEGVISNSIYFTADGIMWDNTEIFVFNLDTKMVEQLPPLVSSSLSFSSARWFFPSFRND
ncbi:hypothetical protein N665_0962s0009 [Sinapis alba]|nr:hypothetical protein N665_0962s0009 [Sinapis alba]